MTQPPPLQRRLTVVLSADVVGYSALMERDEAGTLERLKANRRQVFDPRIARHDGRIVKLMGDGVLVEFASVVSAVQCALEIQQANCAEAQPAQGERIRYRIGINLGEIIVDGDDIYGDGVNVAARLQALAEHAKALQLDPDGYEVNAAAARCYIPMRRYREGIGCLEKAAAAIENDFWALGMAVQCYEGIGDDEGRTSAARRCLERVEKVIAAEPDHGLAIGWGVTSLVALLEVERAKEWTSRAMLLEPDNLNLRYNLACGMVTLGEATMAIELLGPVLARAQRQNLIWFQRDNSMDPIRDDPRMQALFAAAEARLAAAYATQGAAASPA